LLIPLVIVGVGSTALAIGKILLTIQRCLIPSEVIFASYTRLGSILMFVPIIFPSLAIGMMLANLVAWCVRPARRVFNKEAKGVKYASFKTAVKHLAIASLILLIVAAPIALLGALNYFYVTTNGVSVNPLFSTSEIHYKWSDITRIETRCLAERDNLHLNFILYMKDGRKIDLLEEPRLKFVNIYDQVKPLIAAQKHITYSRHSMQNKDIARLRKRYRPQDAERILQIITGKD